MSAGPLTTACRWVVTATARDRPRWILRRDFGLSPRAASEPPDGPPEKAERARRIRRLVRGLAEHRQRDPLPVGFAAGKRLCHVHGLLRFDLGRERRLERIHDRLHDDRAIARKGFVQLLAAKGGIFDAHTPTATRFGEPDEVDWRHLDSVLRIAEKNHLLPLDHAED